MRRWRVLPLFLALGLPLGPVSTEGADLPQTGRKYPMSMPDWSQLMRLPVSAVIQGSLRRATFLVALPDEAQQGRLEIAAMAPEMQRLVWLSVLAGEWGTDGLRTFFYLRGGNLAPEVAEALGEAGLDRHAKIFAEAMALFGKPYPVEEKERDLFFSGSYARMLIDGTTCPPPPNAFDHAMNDLGARFGTKEAYWAAVEG